MENKETKSPAEKGRGLKALMGVLLKRYLVTGLIIIIPLWLTFFVVIILFNWISSFTFPVISYFITDKPWIMTITKVVSFFISVASICLLGFLTNKVLGRTALNYFERLIEKVPLVGTIYTAAKQFVNFLFGKDKNNSFKEVIFVPYPNKDFYSAAFKTGEQLVNGEKYVCAFMPTTPNPTTGFLLLVKEEDIVYTDYTVDQAFQFIISIGVIGMSDKIKKNAEEHNEELQQKLKEIKDEF